MSRDPEPATTCRDYAEMATALAASGAAYRVLLLFLGLRRAGQAREDDELETLLVTERRAEELPDLAAIRDLAASAGADPWEYLLVGPLTNPDGSLPSRDEAAVHLQLLAVRAMEGRGLDAYFAFDRRGRRLEPGA